MFWLPVPFRLVRVTDTNYTPSLFSLNMYRPSREHPSFYCCMCMLYASAVVLGYRLVFVKAEIDYLLTYLFIYLFIYLLLSQRVLTNRPMPPIEQNKAHAVSSCHCFRPTDMYHCRHRNMTLRASCLSSQSSGGAP